MKVMRLSLKIFCAQGLFWIYNSKLRVYRNIGNLWAGNFQGIYSDICSMESRICNPDSDILTVAPSFREKNGSGWGAQSERQTWWWGIWRHTTSTRMGRYGYLSWCPPHSPVPRIYRVYFPRADGSVECLVEACGGQELMRTNIRINLMKSNICWYAIAVKWWVAIHGVLLFL